MARHNGSRKSDGLLQINRMEIRGKPLWANTAQKAATCIDAAEQSHHTRRPRRGSWPSNASSLVMEEGLRPSSLAMCAGVEPRECISRATDRSTGVIRGVIGMAARDNAQQYKRGVARARERWQPRPSKTQSQSTLLEHLRRLKDKCSQHNVSTIL